MHYPGAIRFYITIIVLFTWGLSALQTTEVDLSQDEILWLRNHPVLRLGVGTNFAPIQYVEDKDGTPVYRGISSDYVSRIEEMLGIELEIIHGITFAEALERGRNKEIDLFPCIAENNERKEFLDFTSPYLTFPIVIFTNQDAPFVGSLNDLRGLRIAEVKNLYLYESLRELLPESTFIFEKNVESAMKLLSVGKADAYVTNLAVGSYLIRKNFWNNIKVAAPSPFESSNLRMGIRKDWPVLTQILEKTLAAIEEEERISFQQDWISVRYEYGLNPVTIRNRFIQLFSVFLVFALSFTIWITRLKKEIVKRKIIEKNLIRSKNLQEELLREKDIMMKEIDHRVKNNLLMIIDIIKLQSGKFDENNMDEKDKNLISRISSISSLHEMLYKSDSPHSISVKKYLTKLTGMIERLISSENNPITIDVVCHDRDFSSSIIIKLGLIITELISNSSQHAFTPGNPGIIRVILTEDESRNILSVYDNGKSPPDTILEEKSDRMGLNLVKMLTKQLKGTLKLETDRGTLFTISWPVD